MERCVISRMDEISKNIQELQEQFVIGENLLQRLEVGNVFLQIKEKQNQDTHAIQIEQIPTCNVIFTRRVKSNYQNSDVSIDVCAVENHITKIIIPVKKT